MDFLKDYLGRASDNKEKIYKDSQLEIYDNIMVYGNENNFVQLTNITQVWKGEIPKENLPVGMLFSGALIGLVLLIVGLVSSAILAVIGVIIFGGIVFLAYHLNSKIIQYYGLNIELNSGRMISFTSSDSKCITGAFNVLGNIIKDGVAHGDTMINFGTGNIVSKASSIEIGKDGDVNE